MNIGRVALCASLLAATSLGVVVGESTAVPADRTIDRTYACTTTLWAGIRKFTVQAQTAVPGQKDHEGRNARPLAAFGTGSSSHARLVGAGRESPSPAVAAHGPFWVSTEQCRPTPALVSLSARGLSGGAASPFGDWRECEAPKTVIVRARAVFRSSTALQRNAVTKQLVATAPLVEARLAARTPSGKPLILASVSGSGKVRVFVGPGCVEP